MYNYFNKFNREVSYEEVNWKDKTLIRQNRDMVVGRVNEKNIVYDKKIETKNNWHVLGGIENSEKGSFLYLILKSPPKVRFFDF